MGASAAFPSTRNTIGFPAGHLFGMTLSNNGSDATNDIDFAAGQCRNSTDVVNLIGGAMTKQLDATWAAGTNAGGKMSAAAITDTTYHCFAILKDSDGSVDYGFDTSATAPTMPSGYTYFRRIGSIIRSTVILPFKQQGDNFRLTTIRRDVNANNPGTSAVLAALSVPGGIKVQPTIYVDIYPAGTAGAVTVMITDPDDSDVAPTSSIWNVYGVGAAVDYPNTSLVNIVTNTSSQIRYRLSASASGDILEIVTAGWVDTRGRLA